MPRGIQNSSRREFIKKGKDSSSMEMCKRIKARKMYKECIKMTLVEKNKGGKRSPKCSFNREMKDSKKKKACQAKNLIGLSKQKLGPKKRRRRKEKGVNRTKLET